MAFFFRVLGWPRTGIKRPGLVYVGLMMGGLILASFILLLAILNSSANTVNYNENYWSADAINFDNTHVNRSLVRSFTAQSSINTNLSTVDENIPQANNKDIKDVTVTVNGETVDLPAGGSISQTITDDDNRVSLDVVIQNNALSVDSAAIIDNTSSLQVYSSSTSISDSGNNTVDIIIESQEVAP